MLRGGAAAALRLRAASPGRFLDRHLGRRWRLRLSHGGRRSGGFLSRRDWGRFCRGSGRRSCRGGGYWLRQIDRCRGRGWSRGCGLVRGRCPRDDRGELAGTPSVGHAKDRRVLQEQVCVTAGATDASAERKLPSRPQGQGPAAETARLEVVRPDEVHSTTIAADRGHASHLASSSGGPHVKIVTEANKMGSGVPSARLPEDPSSLLPVRFPG